MTAELRIGDTVQFYRSKHYPGKRGPYAATVVATAVVTQAGKKITVATLAVQGPGGKGTEIAVPVVASAEGQEFMCCVR